MQSSLIILLPGLFLVLTLVLLLLTLWIYRKTNPVVSVLARALLMTIRILALVLVLLVLFQAKLNFTSTKEISPSIAVAIDNSASMSVTDLSGKRPDQLKTVLGSPELTELASAHQLQYYAFDGQAHPVNAARLDSIKFSGDVTDMAAALQYIQQDPNNQNLSAIIMVSDGGYNAGGNPARLARRLQAPVYTIPIGSESPVPDLSIDNLTANPFTYIGTSTPVSVTIRGTGLAGLNIPLTLLVNDSVYTTTMVTLAPSPSEKTIELEYTPSRAGMKKLTCLVPSQPGELLIQNNSKTIYMDVLKARLNVCLLAGQPTPEIGFMQRHISALDRYQVTTFLQTSNGEFYDKGLDYYRTLSEADIIILLNFPTSNTLPQVLSSLQSQLESKHTPVWLVYGKNLNMAKLKALEPFLPVKAVTSKTGLKLVTPQITSNGHGHPVIMGANDGVRAWQKLPPAYSRDNFTALWPGTQVLVNTNNNHPLIAIREDQSQKSAALLAYGSWRWDLLMHGVDNNDNLYPTFIQNMLRWLEIKKETDWLHIRTDKQKYSFGNTVHISVDLNNKDVVPDYKNEITLLMEQPNGTQQLVISPSDSVYAHQFTAETSGDYRITLLEPQIPIDKYQPALFSVGDYSAEMANTRLQSIVLKELATNSGGQLVPRDSLHQLLKIQGKQKITTLHTGLDLWNHRIMLMIIIALLALEWFLRKRFGML